MTALGPVRDARDRDALIRARRQVAGRAGFAMGCIAAAIAAGVNLVRAPRPLSLGFVLLIFLVAAFNVPFGIAMGLLGERVSRGRHVR